MRKGVVSRIKERGEVRRDGGTDGRRNKGRFKKEVVCVR